MPSLNERIRQLEKYQPTQNMWDMLDPDQQRDILAETIRCLERDVAEGRGNEPWAAGYSNQTVAEALLMWKGYLADWERDHGLTH
ncbi:hypothetical protein [Rhodanobacter sp. DHB23]|uniref:hypothetical protein n=1 Tax=Rhodanobacter sp. DHB23 TaxID=2775923 RepID=UPI00178700AC|nr:hypothetical protein [Rhodanobacter sp. DHB23]MBD8873873.1 hypothetical protein [Rhodanobacter sp. DHB23]